MIADRHLERSFVSELLSGNPEKRVALIHAAPGCGKTFLIQDLKRQAEEAKVASVHIELKGTPPLHSVLRVFSIRLPAELLIHSNRIPDSRAGGNLTANLSNAQIGHGASVQVINDGVAEGITESKLNALLRDLKECSTKVIVFIDTYEQSHSATNHFVETLLQLCCFKSNLRMIVAGQKIPDPSNGSWQDSVQAFELTPIREVKHWIEIVQIMEPPIVNFAFEKRLAEDCEALDGNPAAISALINYRVKKFREERNGC